MVALGVHRVGMCPNCGRPLEVCTDPTSEDAWAVPPPTRCFPSTALAIAQKPYQEQPHASALLWRTTRR
jgi:hypothetical protein